MLCDVSTHSRTRDAGHAMLDTWRWTRVLHVRTFPDSNFCVSYLLLAPTEVSANVDMFGHTLHDVSGLVGTCLALSLNDHYRFDRFVARLPSLTSEPNKHYCLVRKIF